MLAIEEIKSTGELSLFTESFWKFTPASDCQVMTLFPEGTFNVIVASSSFSIDSIKSYDKGIYLIPISIKSYSVVSSNRIFGIRMKAFSLLNLYRSNGISFQEISEIVPLTLNANFTDNLFVRLAKSESIKDALVILELLNYQLIYKDYSIHVSLRDKVNYILERKGNVEIQEICDSFDISRQALHKSFKKAFGLGPKELSTIWKLNYFYLLAKKDQSLTSSAYDAGYYDQAHCIKSFKSVWNTNPKHLNQSTDALMDHLTNTIDRRFNNYYDPEV